MIQIDNISKSYPSRTLFSNVNIAIKKGMRAGLVGKNGSGKTTLFKLMLGEINPDQGNIKRSKNLTIGHLAQEIISGNQKSILDTVLESNPEILDIEKKMKSLSQKISEKPNDIHLIDKLGDIQNRYDSLGGWNIEKKAKKILSGLGFKESQFSFPMENFSGGWRMRVSLASILLKDPDILFLDEPTNHLDLEATIWLEKFLDNWGGAMIVISHDRTFLDKCVTHILDIDLKMVVLYFGNYSDYLKTKKINVEHQINAYKNQQKEIKSTEKFIERFRYKNTKSSQVQSRVKKLEKMERIELPIEDNTSIILSLPEPDRSPLKIVTCTSVKKTFGDLVVFDDLNVTIERGEKIGLVGVNGAGKSTLLKMLGMVEAPTSGNVVCGPDIKVSYYAQHQLEVLDEDDTVFESINKVSTGLGETKLRNYLGGFLFTGDEIEKVVKVLSGGEKARLALARMLISPSHLLLLDEPTNHLDMISRNVIENAFSNYGGAIVCISHDRHFLNKVTKTTWEIGNRTAKFYSGNYEYYEWKTNQVIEKNQERLFQQNKKTSPLNYTKRKKLNNRLSYIDRRFVLIEKKLDDLSIIINDKKNETNDILLNDALSDFNTLENEYMDLINERDELKLILQNNF